MQPPPPSAPPQWSPDGRWWWNGVQWMPRELVTAPPPTSYYVPPTPPAYYVPPPPPYYASAPFVLKPSPGLRIFLLVVLVLDALVTGVFALAGTIAVASGSNTTADFVLLSILAALFALSVAAIIGVAVRARWSRWIALAAGIGTSLTCLGLVLGIPIVVAAARAPDLNRPWGQVGRLT